MACGNAAEPRREVPDSRQILPHPRLPEVAPPLPPEHLAAEGAQPQLRAPMPRLQERNEALEDEALEDEVVDEAAACSSIRNTKRRVVPIRPISLKTIPRQIACHRECPEL